MRRFLVGLCLVLVSCEGRILWGNSAESEPGAGGTASGSGNGGVGSSGGEGGAGGQATGGGMADVNPCTVDPSPEATPLRRLAHEEFRFAAKDIFTNTNVRTVIDARADTLPADSTSLGFKNSSAFLDVKSVLGQAYFEAAEAIAAKAVEDLPSLLPCTPSATVTEASCAAQFVRTFGRRAYRRALTTQEEAAYVALYTQARTRGDDFKTGIEGVVMTFMLSPQFLYRVEVDAPTDASVRPVAPLELASRLSFFLWRSGPDETLLAAAEGGRLQNAADVAREANRMLLDPKAERLTQFFEEWLDIDELGALQRDGTLYPNLSTQLPTYFRQETQEFIKSVLMRGDKKFSTLLTAPYTYVNGPLATHYGMTGVTGTAFTRVNQQGRRGGVLMLSGALVNHDKANRTSIVNRGLKLRTLLLCQPIPQPMFVPPPLTEANPALTQAQKLEQHRNNVACSGCHSQMDPLGNAFENIDPVGRPRSVDEKGRTIVTAGAITGTSFDAEVTDGFDLVTKFSTAKDVRGCFVTQLYRFAEGRKETATDACSMYRLRDRFETSGGDMADLLLGLTQSDDFMFRRTVQP